jgi:hypothetical protein
MGRGIAITALFYLLAAVGVHAQRASPCGSCVEGAGRNAPGNYGPGSVTYFFHNRCFGVTVTATLTDRNGSTERVYLDSGHTGSATCTSGPNCTYQVIQEECRSR